MPALGFRLRLSHDLKLLLAARVIRSAAQALLTISVPLYLVAAGHGPLTVGGVLSAGSMGSIVLVVLVGVTAHRLGSRVVLIALAILGCVGSAAFALTTDAMALALMAALATIGRGGGAGSGGAWGPFFPAEQPLIAACVSDRDRNAAFALLSMAGVAGSAAGSLLAGLPTLLTTAFDMGFVDAFRPAFLVAALAGAAVIGLVAQVREVGFSGPPARLLTIPSSARQLIGRLWLTNSLNGFIIGALGPFMTYWFSIRYGVGPATLGVLYTAVNLATIVAFLGAPVLATRLGSVRAVMGTRLAGSVCFAAMALAPGFALAAVAYAARAMLNAVSATLRQSFVMGVSEERSRPAVAAFGNLPAQLTGTVTPTLGAYLVHAVSVELPIWLATIAMAANAILYGALFRRFTPPEERPAAK